MPPPHPAALPKLLVSVLLTALLGLPPLAVGAQTVSPARGERLYRQVLAPGLLACMDCHGDDPERQNFGNIAAARNSPTAIERAVAANTGGMRVFNDFLRAQDYADLAAFLGVPVQRLDFAETAVGELSAPQALRVLGSSKRRVEALQWQLDGEDFNLSAGDCTATLEPLQSCNLLLSLRPQSGGERQGTLRLRHADSRGEILVALSGRAPPTPPAVVRLQPATLDFGDQGGVRRMELVNDSRSPLRLQDITLTGDGFTIWGGRCADGLRLQGAERCTLDLLREPGRTAGQATLRWRHDGQGGETTGLLRAPDSAVADGLAPPPAATPSAPSGLQLRLPAQPLHTPLGTERDLRVWWVNRSGAALSPPELRWEGDPSLALRESRCSGVVQLLPGQACALRLRHAPTQPGRQGGSLVAPGQAPLPVRVETREGSVLLDRRELRAAPDAESVLTLQQQGRAALALGTWRILGPGRAGWQLASDCAAQLDVGQRCRVSVRRLSHAGAQPDLAPAQLVGEVRVVGTAGTVGTVDSESIELPLRPAGEAPNPSATPADGLLVVEAADAQALRWTLRNDTASALDLLSAAWGGRDPEAFAIDAQQSSCGAALAAGQRCTLQGVLLAPAAGDHAAQWQHPQRTLALRATALEPTQARPTWRGAALDFEVREGASSALAQWLVNEGTQAWRVAGLLVGEGYARVGGNCPTPPFVLPAGGACRVMLNWQAGAAGALLVAQSTDGELLSLPLTVHESTVGRTNSGAGGGAGGSAGRADLLLALMLLAALLGVRQKRPPQ